MIKVNINEHEIKKDKSYPKLMKTKSGLIVLMQADGNGTVIQANKYWPTGHSSGGWAMNDFTDFNGSITLSNEVGS